MEIASHKDTPVLRAERIRLKGQRNPLRRSAALHPETVRARSELVVGLGRYYRSGLDA